MMDETPGGHRAGLAELTANAKAHFHWPSAGLLLTAMGHPAAGETVPGSDWEQSWEPLAFTLSPPSQVGRL